jgi:alkylhydroperoxidase family enzyme
MAMNNSESARDRAPTTDQIAAAGTADSTDRSSPGQRPLGNGQQPASATQAAGSGPGVSDQAPAQLLEDDQLQSIMARWKDIQAEFVDEPRKAVQDADALVADLMQRLARMFASERDQLESRWAGGDEVSTEELRRGLRRYRSFFERLLAA